MSYALHILILTGIYAILAVSLNLLAGYTGLLSICQAGFYGIGAYTTALLVRDASVSWLISVLVSMGLAGSIAWVVGRVSLRFRDDYFVVATFAFQVIIYSLMQNWIDLTMGPIGLAGIARPVIFGWRIDNQWEYLCLTLVFAAVAMWIVHRLAGAPFGRVLKAIREDEIFVQALARDVAAFKGEAFVVGAILAAIAGSLYAPYISYIDPTSFTVNESIFILAMVIIGGRGSVAGSLVGAAVLVALPESLRFLGLPSSASANIREILYGAGLVGFMLWRPKGLLGELDYRGGVAR